MIKIIPFLAFVLLMPCASYADIASKAYVDKKAETSVKTTGNQSIDGTKTYTASPIVPTPPLP